MFGNRTNSNSQYPSGYGWNGSSYAKPLMLIFASVSVATVLYTMRDTLGEKLGICSPKYSLDLVDMVFDLSNYGVLRKGKILEVKGLKLEIMEIYLTVMMNYVQLMESRDVSVIVYRSVDDSVIIVEDDEVDDKGSVNKDLNLRFERSNEILLNKSDSRKKLFEFEYVTNPERPVYKYTYIGDVSDNDDLATHLGWMVDRVSLINEVNGFKDNDSFKPLVGALQTLHASVNGSLQDDGMVPALN